MTTAPFAIGDAVHCVDQGPREEWADFYDDVEYVDGLLRPNVRYIVRDLHPPYEGTSEWGVDIGVGCADGSRWWGADRFQRCPLGEPVWLQSASQDHSA